MSVLLGSIWLMSWEGLKAEAAVFWTDVTRSGDKPSPRHGPSIAYDTARGQVVLFGGRNRYTPINFQDTWVYDDDNPVRQGYWTIDACRGFPDGITEPCYWHYRYHTQHCTPGQRCSKLVVFFSTGLETCDEPATFTTHLGKGKILQGYTVADPTTGDGYVAVCANTFLTGAAGPGQVSFNDEALRVDQLMVNIADHTSPSPTPQARFMRSLWDGRHLLWSGVSHGAAPRSSSWRARILTGIMPGGRGAPSRGPVFTMVSTT